MEKLRCKYRVLGSDPDVYWVEPLPGTQIKDSAVDACYIAKRTKKHVILFHNHPIHVEAEDTPEVVLAKYKHLTKMWSAVQEELRRSRGIPPPIPPPLAGWGMV